MNLAFARGHRSNLHSALKEARGTLISRSKPAMSDVKSDRLAAEANELYWHSARPAGRLADELGISRSKFYALIEPLQLEIACEVCGAPLTFNSRTDREAGRGRCSGCGAVVDVAPEVLEPEVAPAGDPTQSTEGVLLSPSADHRFGPRELWLTAFAGVAAGLAVTAWWRRR